MKIDNLRFTEIGIEAAVVYQVGVDQESVNHQIAANLTDFIDFSKWSFEGILDGTEDRIVSYVGRSDIIRVIDQTEGVERINLNDFRIFKDRDEIDSGTDISIPAEQLPKLTSLKISGV